MSLYKSFSFSDDLNLLENTQLEASAGTGKTFSIERIVALLIAKHSLKISQVLIVTFTKKAARELKDRIRNILHTSYHRGFIDLGITSLELKGQELENLGKASLEFEKASIFTIHSFCLNTLKAYPFESLSQFKMEMDNEGDLSEEVIWDYMREIGQSMEPKTLLSYRAFLQGQSFQEAIGQITKYINSELLEPAVELIPSKNYRDELIQSLLDFNKGKGDLFSKWKVLCQSLPDLNELEDLGMKLAKGKIKKLSHIEKIIECDDFLKVNALLCKEKVTTTLVQFLPQFIEDNLKKSADLNLALNNKFVQAVEDFFAYYLYDEEKLENDLYNSTLKAAFLFESYGNIIKSLNSKKEKTGKLDFNDLIGKVHRALCGPKEIKRDQLIEEVKKRYRTVLVDEFQDTDSRQWDIFNTLFASDENHNYFLVGDPKQSIYGFRGADLEIYYNAGKSESLKNRYTLDKNYRSVATLVQGVNVFFKQVFRKEMHCGSTVQTPFYEVGPGQSNDKCLGDSQSSFEFIRINSVYDEEKGISNLKKAKTLYFSLIAYKIFDLLNKKIQLKEKTVEPGHMAILTESNKECEDLQNLLNFYGIPSVITSREQVFDTFEASEFLLLLQALVQLNNSSIKQLMLSSFFELSPSQTEECELNGTVDLFAGQIFQWRDLVDRGRFFEMLHELFNYRGFSQVDQSYEEHLLSRKNGERSYSNMRQIVEYLHGEQHSSKLDAEELYGLLLNKINLPSKGEEHLLRLDKDSQAVQIMTIHASKGLEFPIVFFAAALKKDMRSTFSPMYNFVGEQGRYYDFLKLEKNKISQSMDLWEERKRLYYVALTRASSKLYMPFIQNGDFSYLTSLYSSFSMEEVKSLVTDHEQLISFSLPIHSGLKIKSSKKSNLKKDVLSTIDDSVFKLIGENETFFSLDEQLEINYLGQTGQENLFYREVDKPVQLQCLELKNVHGFENRYRNVSSYSSLIRDKIIRKGDYGSEEDADRDGVVETPLESDLKEVVLTRGAVLGELVHLLFEKLDYQLVAQVDLKTYCELDDVDLLFKSLSVRFFNNKWYIKFSKQLKNVVYKTLSTGINGGFSLSSLLIEQRIHEMEFHMTVKNCSGLESSVFKSFKGSMEEGFLKGFIDLLYKVDGKIFMVDWKTTSSPKGDSSESYGKEVLDELMESHYYSFQSMIYLVALYKFMKLSKHEDFDYSRDFGGIYYLFVRGMTGEMDSPYGVHFFKPEESVLLHFARQFTEVDLTNE